MTMTGSQDKVLVQLSELPLGEPLSWPVYDSQGCLLLNQGFVVSNARQRDLILRRGGVRPVDPLVGSKSNMAGIGEAKSYPLFELLEYLICRLEAVNRAIFSAQKSPAYLLCNKLALDIQYLLEVCPDRLLAILLMDEKALYQLIHPLHTAVCCELIAIELKLNRQERLPLLCAALTHDLGIQKMQADLDHQEQGLSPEQLEEVHRHPTLSVHYLETAGIKHPVWLRAVAEHHERLDGSGYPEGLEGDQISMEGRILGLCDSFSAMVRHRGHREALRTPNALIELQRHKREEFDEQLIMYLIDNMGMTAPGSLVGLKNGMIAIVRARGPAPESAQLFGLLDCSGKPLPAPLELDTDLPEYQVEGFLSRDDYSWLFDSLNQLWPPISLVLD